MSRDAKPLPENQLLPPGHWATLETYFLGAGYRSASGIYTLGFGADEKAWLDFKASVPRGATVHHYICWTFDSEQLPPNDGDEPEPDLASELSIKPPRKKDKPKGSHGAYWQELYKHGVFNIPDIAEALRSEGGEFGDGAGQVKAALKARFEVESLTFISPEQFEKWLEYHHLHGTISLSRQAANKVQG